MVKAFRDDHQLRTQGCESVSQSSHIGLAGVLVGEREPLWAVILKEAWEQVFREWVSIRASVGKHHSDPRACRSKPRRLH